MGTTRYVRWLGIAILVLGGTVAGAQTAGTDVLLQRLEQLAGEYAQGGTMTGAARTGTLGEGQEKRIGLHLEAGKCYVFIGVGDGELADLDMRWSPGHAAGRGHPAGQLPRRARLLPDRRARRDRACRHPWCRLLHSGSV